MRWKSSLVATVLMLSACAAETASTTSQQPSTTTSTVAAPTTSSTSSTTTPATTTTTGQAIDVEISNGEITGTDRFRFDRGQIVEITILSDMAYEVHVHGYDHRYHLEAGEPFTIEFTADVPGIFEVETHPDHLVLFEIEVGA